MDINMDIKITSQEKANNIIYFELNSTSTVWLSLVRNLNIYIFLFRKREEQKSLKENSRTELHLIMHSHQRHDTFIKLELYVVIITADGSFIICVILSLSNSICMQLL